VKTRKVVYRAFTAFAFLVAVLSCLLLPAVLLLSVTVASSLPVSATVALLCLGVPSALVFSNAVSARALSTARMFASRS